MRSLRRFAALVALCALSMGAALGEEVATRDFFAMDTYMTFAAYGDAAGSALAEAEARVLALEAAWSVTDPDSRIYALNHAQGRSVDVDADTLAILRFCLEMAERTGGLLDPTIYPVLAAWGFTTGEYRVPAQAEIDALLGYVGYAQLELSETSARLPAGAQLDLGAVGKGWAGDEAAEVLQDRGVTSALLSLGGNVQAVGAKPDGSPWRVGVLLPGEATHFCVLEIRDCAVVTSGNDQRYFTGEDGTVYGHILDPRTGYPARSGLACATVVGAEGELCDALSTALFIMGAEAAAGHWRAHGDFEMVLLSEAGEVYVTEGLESAFSLAPGCEQMPVTVIRR